MLFALAGCYAPSTLRAEHTALAPSAGATMIAATSAIPQEASKQQLFERHYQAALGFYEQAKYPEAIAEFEAAYEVDPQPLLMFNVAQAYRKSGHLEEALAKYREYLAKDPEAERGKIDELIRELERKLGKPRKTSSR